jgi:hypothetical protein
VTVKPRPRGSRHPNHAILGASLDVLLIIAGSGMGGMTVPRLARLTGKDRQWLHRVIRVLEHHVPDFEVRLRGAPHPTVYRLKRHAAWVAALTRD